MTDANEKFVSELVMRIRVRQTAGGGVCVLDLRHARFGNRIPRVLSVPPGRWLAVQGPYDVGSRDRRAVGAGGLRVAITPGNAGCGDRRAQRQNF